MILFIDTSDFNKVTFALVGKKVLKKSYRINPRESHETLKKLDEFLKSVKCQRSDVKGVYVCSGPGSYTGVRIGVTAAQALGFAWQIPVTALEKEKVPVSLLDLAKVKGKRLYRP